MICPRSGVLTHPSDSFDHFFMGGLYRPQKDRLMVSDAISQASDCVEATMNCAAWFATAGKECLMQACSPNGRIVTSSRRRSGSDKGAGTVRI